MIKKYVYDGEEYASSWQVRQAISRKENKAFSVEPTEGKEEFWAALGVTYTEEPDPEPTEEEKAAQALEEAKRLRAAKVAAITVEVDGLVFDGDEMAQSRMARAITAAETSGLDKTTWVLADNTVSEVTKAQLQQALSKAMIAMGEVWTEPYEEVSENPKSASTLGVPTIGI